MFRGRKSGDCEKTLIIVMEHVKLEFPSKVRNVIDNVLGADRAPDFRLFLTGFVRFWNSETVQCDGVSWSYWQESEPHSGGELMIRERRQKMNAWITQVNDIIGSVVTQYRDKGDKRVNFVNYDMEFEGHRFCEHGVIEPQRGNEDRKDTYLFQYETSKDSLWGIDDKNTAAGPAVDWMKWLVDAHTEDAGLKVNEYYVNQAVSLDTQYNEFLPIFISKIFHPTPSGHRTIAVAIKDAMNAPSEIGRAINHPARLLDQAVQCGEDLTLTFPKFWVLEDGRLSAREILQRMRDHSCSGTCDALPGVIGHLQEFKRQYESGCEYAVKIGPDKELFHYSSGSGENCYTASDLMIDQCISTQKDRNTPLKSGGSITGPNYGSSSICYSSQVSSSLPLLCPLSRPFFPYPSSHRLPLYPKTQAQTHPRTQTNPFSNRRELGNWRPRHERQRKQPRLLPNHQRPPSLLPNQLRPTNTMGRTIRELPPLAQQLGRQPRRRLAQTRPEERSHASTHPFQIPTPLGLHVRGWHPRRYKNLVSRPPLIGPWTGAVTGSVLWV